MPVERGGKPGGQTIIALSGPDDGHHLDWTLSANPPGYIDGGVIANNPR